MDHQDQDLLLNHEEKSRIELLQAFHHRGYSKSAAVEKIVMARLPHEKWQGSIKGVLLICLGICYVLIGRSTNGIFRFEIDSAGDVLRLNEWVFKPFIIVSFFLLGILLVRNRENFPFKLKTFYLIMIGLIGFCEAFNNYLFNLIVSLAAFYAVFSVKEKSKKILSSSTLDISSVEGSRDEKAFTLIEKGFLVHDIEDLLLMNYWRGHVIFPFYMIMAILFFSAPINAPFNVLNEEHYDQYRLTSNAILGLFGITLLTGILLGINEKFLIRLARFVLAGIFGAAALLIFVSFGFQIIGVLLVLLSIASMMIALQRGAKPS